MAFENIDAGSLKSALNSCKNSINNNISKDLKSSIVTSDVWISDSRSTLKGALERLEGVYNELNGTLDHYLNIANEIEKYKKLEARNNELKRQCNDLNNRLYRQERYDRWYQDEETGEWKSTPDTRTVKDINVENQINNAKAEIARNEESMQSISNNVENSL